jgi:hypothetical protein
LASKVNQSIPDILKLENWMYEGLLAAHEEYQKEFYKAIANALKGIKVSK